MYVSMAAPRNQPFWMLYVSDTSSLAPWALAKQLANILRAQNADKLIHYGGEVVNYLISTSPCK